MKKIILLSAALCLIAASAFAAQNAKIDDVSYKGAGKVEIDLKDNTVKDPKIVWTKQETAVVRDSSGKVVSADITKQDDDTVAIFVRNIIPYERYNFHVSNINFGSQTQATFVGSFVAEPQKKKIAQTSQGTPDGAPTAKINSTLFIGKMEFDKGGKLEIDIDDAVGHDNEIRWDGTEKAIVKDQNGKTYPAKITKTDKDEADIYISGLTQGRQYSILVTGFMYRGARSSVVGDFTAANNWEFKDPRHK